MLPFGFSRLKVKVVDLAVAICVINARAPAIRQWRLEKEREEGEVKRERRKNTGMFCLESETRCRIRKQAAARKMAATFYM